jgi:hypothetical protein
MKSKPLTLRQINKNFRKFQRDVKAAFDASPFSFAATAKAENLLELKNAIVNGDLVTVKQILKEYPGIVNEVERLFSLILLFLTHIFQGLDEFGSTPLMVATRRKQLPIEDFLLRASPKVNLNATDIVRGLDIFCKFAFAQLTIDKCLFPKFCLYLLEK